jgi:hypothetical protein
MIWRNFEGLGRISGALWFKIPCFIGQIGEKFTGSKEGLSISIYEFKWCEQYEQQVLDDWKGDEALF